MKKSIIPLLAVLFFGCSNDFSDSSIDVLRPEKEDSVERVAIREYPPHFPLLSLPRRMVRQKKNLFVL